MPDKTRLQTEINFLSALERGDVVTQRSLAKRISVSVGLINALLKRAVQKGFVKAKAAPYKRYAYYITPKGFAEKSRLVADYIEASLDFFRRARQEYAALFSRAQARGVRRFVLVGRGELAEIALLAAREVDVEILGILDCEVSAERLYGLRVLRSLDDVTESNTLVITASRHPQEVFDWVRDRFADQQVLAPPHLRIVRQPLDFRPPKVLPKGTGR